MIVPWSDGGADLIEQVRIPERPVPLATRRALQQISVSVYPNQFKALDAAGAISRVGAEGQFKVLLDPKYYDDAVGLTLGAAMRSVESNIM